MRFYPYEFKTTVMKIEYYNDFAVSRSRTEWNDKYQCEIALKEDTLSNSYISWFLQYFHCI